MTAAPYRGVPVWTQGTATIANGQRIVTLTNSGIIATDAASGLDYSAVRDGDFFVVDGIGYCLITEVAGVSGASTATLTLAVNWTAPTQTAVAYRVSRMSMTSTGEARALMQQLLARGDKDSPFIKFYTDDSTGRLVVDPHAGAPGLYVGQTGVSDAALLAALTADRATGAVSFPSGVTGWALTGFRNRLCNASFAINQREVVGAVSLAAGAYGHDGLKAGASGSTYTYGSSGLGLDTLINPSAGSLIMPIEASMIEGGSYVLSHEGTAQARIWQGTGYVGSGAYATASRSAPLIVTGLAPNTQTNVEFANGTILRPQFEPGGFVQAYERRHPGVEFMLCERYYQRITGWGGGWQFGPNDLAVIGRFRTKMAAWPTIILVNGTQGAEQYSWSFQNILSIITTTVDADGGSMLLSTSTANQGTLGGLTRVAQIYAKAEL